MPDIVKYSQKQLSPEIEKTRFFTAFFISTLLVAIMWVSFVFDSTLGMDFARFGVFPRTLHGLWGILFSPFIHANFEHIFSNTFPFWILSTALLFFYPRKGLLILLIIALGAGSFTWIAGREAYHIGASGVIYGLAAFIFFSGILSKQRAYIAVSLIVIFLYGSLVWGMFPSVNRQISWEGHLGGFATGTILSLIYHPLLLTDSHKPDITVDIDFIYNFEYFSSTLKRQKILYIYRKFDNQLEKYYINEKYSFNSGNTNVNGKFESTKTVF